VYSLLTDNYKCNLSTFLKSCRPSPCWPKTQFCLYTVLRTLNMKYKCQVFFHDLPLRAELLYSGCKVVLQTELKVMVEHDHKFKNTAVRIRGVQPFLG
jgi:hypothetical protein